MAINQDYIIDASIEDVGLDADILYKALLGDQCFCITDICPPPVDFDGKEWQIPFDENGDMFKANKRVEVSELTNEDGTGAFDVILASLKSVLHTEYDKGRINGPEYSRTFAALIQAALGNATNLLLQRDLTYWQAQRGLYDAWTAKAQVELAKHQIALAQMQQINQQVEFANGKIKLLVGKENYTNAMANREVTVAKQAEMQDTQMALYNQQIVSYQRDAEVKAARIFSDAWITMKTIDEGISPPNGFTNARIDDVLKTLRDNNGFDITP